MGAKSEKNFLETAVVTLAPPTLRDLFCFEKKAVYGPVS